MIMPYIRGKKIGLFIVFPSVRCLTGENEKEMGTKEQKFSRVVEEYKRTIYTVCWMFSKDEDEVNDLFQEILIRLWQGFDSYEGKSDIKTWIYRVSLNFCLNYDKKQKRVGNRVSLGAEIGPCEDNYEKSLQVKRLYKRINALGLVDRSVVLLWLEGLSYDEIGAILGIRHSLSIIHTTVPSAPPSYM